MFVGKLIRFLFPEFRVTVYRNGVQVYKGKSKKIGKATFEHECRKCAIAGGGKVQMISKRGSIVRTEKRCNYG